MHQKQQEHKKDGKTKQRNEYKTGRDREKTAAVCVRWGGDKMSLNTQYNTVVQ